MREKVGRKRLRKSKQSPAQSILHRIMHTCLSCWFNKGHSPPLSEPFSNQDVPTPEPVLLVAIKRLCVLLSTDQTLMFPIAFERQIQPCGKRTHPSPIIVLTLGKPCVCSLAGAEVSGKYHKQHRGRSPNQQHTDKGTRPTTNRTKKNGKETKATR